MTDVIVQDDFVQLVEIDVLKSAAENGTFTPIIGAACSTLDHEGEPRAKMIADIRKRARTIATQLDAEEREYLEELIDADTSVGDDAGPIDSRLLAFYVAIVRLDRCATLTFKQGVDQYKKADAKPIRYWKRRPKSFLSLPRLMSDWEIPLAFSNLHVALAENLQRAITAGEALHDSRRNDPWHAQGFGAKGIAANLKLFQSSIVDDHGHVRPDATLNLLDLVWIGNLFWHALRFDLPYYPTTAELAFQLSLHKASAATAARGTPPPLAQAAQAITDPLGHISDWFETYSKHRRVSPFYEALAKWLIRTYKDYEASQSGRHRRIPLPLVFTTNYDREIEEALKAAHCSYHVVLPLQFVSQHTNERHEPICHEKPLWLMKTVQYEGDEQHISWSYAGTTEDTTRSNSDDSTDDPYIGPVIVKLHGSPLEKVPTAKTEVKRLPHEQKSRLESKTFTIEYRHRIIVSESDYLADLRRDLPVWLRDRLASPGRTLFFLGHSVADWNIRLRLADHAAWSDRSEAKGDFPSPANRGRLNRFAVNRSPGGFEIAFMGPLGIGYLKTDLWEVQQLLETVLLEKAAREQAR